MLTSYKTAPHNHYQPHPTKPDQHTPNAVTWSLFSWRWTQWCPKHVETEVNNKHLNGASCWFFSSHTCRYVGIGQQLTCLWIFLNGLQLPRFEISHSSVFETFSIHWNSSRILHCVRYIFINVSKTLWPFQVSETIYPAIKCNPQKRNSSTSNLNLNLNIWYHSNVTDSTAPSESETEGINCVTKKKAWSLMFITKNTHLNIRLIH